MSALSHLLLRSKLLNGFSRLIKNYTAKNSSRNLLYRRMEKVIQATRQRQCLSARPSAGPTFRYGPRNVPFPSIFSSVKR